MLFDKMPEKSQSCKCYFLIIIASGAYNAASSLRKTYQKDSPLSTRQFRFGEEMNVNVSVKYIFENSKNLIGKEGHEHNGNKVLSSLNMTNTVQ